MRLSVCKRESSVWTTWRRRTQATSKSTNLRERWVLPRCPFSVCLDVSLSLLSSAIICYPPLYVLCWKHLPVLSLLATTLRLLCLICFHLVWFQMMKIYDKLCELKSCNSLTGRVIEQRISYKGSRHPEINKKVGKHQGLPKGVFFAGVYWSRNSQIGSASPSQKESYCRTNKIFSHFLTLSVYHMQTENNLYNLYNIPVCCGKQVDYIAHVCNYPLFFFFLFLSLSFSLSFPFFQSYFLPSLCLCPSRLSVTSTAQRSGGTRRTTATSFSWCSAPTSATACHWAAASCLRSPRMPSRRPAAACKTAAIWTWSTTLARTSQMSSSPVRVLANSLASLATVLYG